MKTYPPIQTAIVLALGLCVTLATSAPLPNPLILSAQTQATLSDGSPVHVTIRASQGVTPRAEYFRLDLYLESGDISGTGRSVRIIPDNPDREIMEYPFDVDNRYLSFAMLDDCLPEQECVTGLTIEYVETRGTIGQADITATAEMALPEGSTTPPRGSISIQID